MPSDRPRAVVVPADEDPLRVLAERVCQDAASRLPDLSSTTIIVPGAHLTAPLRAALLAAASAHGFTALLLPRIESLRSFAFRDPESNAESLTGYARELLLAEVLASYPELYGKANPWSLAEELIRLFDELTLNCQSLPHSLDEFARYLKHAYACQPGMLQPLEREAALVHTLWQAWHAQMKALNVVDENAAYVARLANSGNAQGAGDRLYIADFLTVTRSEKQWIRHMQETGSATGFFHMQDPEGEHSTDTRGSESPRARFFDAVYSSSDLSMSERAGEFVATFPDDPIGGTLHVYAANSNEDEACAVDVQVRRWLLEGRSRIGIVTEDRRLARRIRALLERAEVSLDDLGGWALSTTSAATGLERWLQCIEEDFSYPPLLDVLKSPLTFPHRDRTALLSLVYRFEEDIVRNENVPRNMRRYRDHLRRRATRLPSDMAALYPEIDSLLKDIESAAEPLSALLGHRQRSPTEFLDGLNASVERIGFLESWRTDAAGSSILREIAALRRASAQSNSRMRWTDFRAWLGRALERNSFVPPSGGQRVRIVSLAQSAGLIFDGIVVAGCDREHFPGSRLNSPFFNASVRAQLGLPTEEQRQIARRIEFHRLLVSAPRILITRVQRRASELVIASPWLQLIETFYKLSYRADLQDPHLEYLVPRAQVIRGDGAPLPERTSRPRAVIPERLLPTRYSPDSYDRLLDCPYQFFVANALKLRAPEEIREVLKKDDFGRRVHLCIQAFFKPVQGLPPPFSRRVSESSREEAVAHLELISRSVFKKDLEDSFQHRAWLKQWLRVVPSFITWEIKMSANYQLKGVEVSAERPMDDSIMKIAGRLDRVDVDGNRLRVVDYKTGTPPGIAEVEAGERIQLPLYAALARLSNTVSIRTEYVQLQEEKVKSVSTLEGEALDVLSAAVVERLRMLDQSMRDGEAAPAWGDTQTCERCTMDGICRRAYWIESEVEADAEAER